MTLTEKKGTKENDWKVNEISSRLTFQVVWGDRQR